MTTATPENSPQVPRHIGFIVDGNRRWARERGLPTLEGHRRGFDRVEKVAEAAINKGCEFVSFYLFSTENWNRSEEEVAYLMDLVRKNIIRLTKKFKKNDIRCVILGRQEPAPDDVWQSLMDCEEQTKDGKKGTVCICFNYGGQWEIADAVSKLIRERVVRTGGTPDEARSDSEHAAGASGLRQDPFTEITPEIVAQYLYHPEVPPCDLIVRTSGEERISGFQLWRAAYSEFNFYEKKFPDFDLEDLDIVLDDFSKRQRRFGH